jgi:glycosyltransferase involved in cell wall biosynthesis
MGLPMIAANYPGMLTLVEGEGVGLCVDPQSPRAIAAAVNRLAADPEGRARMRDTGLRLSRERYNWAVESAPLLQLYRALASGDTVA